MSYYSDYGNAERAMDAAMIELREREAWERRAARAETPEELERIRREWQMRRRVL